MDATLIKDKRLFERIAVRLPLRFLDFGANKVGRAEACDLSANGLGLISNEPLALNTSLGVWLEIPDQGDPFYAQGSVVWSNAIAEDKHRIGVRLENPQLMGLGRVLRLNQDFV